MKKSARLERATDAKRGSDPATVCTLNLESLMTQLLAT
jgi:hypothetical protein